MATIQPALELPAGSVATGGYFPWLDGLRVFSALSVLVFHLISVASLKLPYGYPWWWLHFGLYGLDLFFAISGAVIVLSIARTHARSPERFRRRFMLQRLARVAPLLWLTCAADLVFNRPEFWSGPQPLLTVLAHLTFVNNWFAQTHGAINGPSWSLALEMQFYLLMAWVSPWILQTRRGLGWCALAFALAWCWRLGVLSSVSAGSSPTADSDVFRYATQLPGVLDGFAGGVAAALIYRYLQARGGLRLRLRWSLGLLILALAAWVAVLEMALTHMAHYWSAMPSAVHLRSLTALAAALSVAAGLLAPAPGPWVSRALISGGQLTFGIYLWHMPVLTWMMAKAGNSTPWMTALATLGVTLLLAALSWRYIEAPCIRFVRRH